MPVKVIPTYLDDPGAGTLRIAVGTKTEVEVEVIDLIMRPIEEVEENFQLHRTM